jgi:putative transposase
MSLPREVLPNSTYLVTRRCTQRQFLLRPSAYVIETFLYCLAVAAQRTGVIIHAVTVMSNHYHLIATDPLARLPEFCAWLHEFVAKALNRHLGRRENFWATEQTSFVRLMTPEDVLDKVAYTVANPVAAGLVARGDEWPGVRLYTPGRRIFRRPKGFFRANGPLPEVAELNIVAAPVSDGDEQRRLALIEQAVQKCELAVRNQFRRTNRKFLGAKAVLAQRTDSVATTPEPARGLSPRVACRNKWLRLETLERNARFVLRHREAFLAWRDLEKRPNVVFPPGTYRMRRFNVLLAPS